MVRCMFTGIVQTKATVIEIVEKSQFRKLTIGLLPKWIENLTIGASVAVNGCCLTAVKFGISEQHGEQAFIEFDVIDETLSRTTLGNLKRGDQVNVERSLQMGTELGGHIVSGHIQTTATLQSRIDSDDNCRMEFRLEPKWIEYIFEKGFIAVNGISLTVGEVTKNGFWLHLIPETLSATNLGEMEEGGEVNIEVDQSTFTTVETVKRVLERQGKF